MKRFKSVKGLWIWLLVVLMVFVCSSGFAFERIKFGVISDPHLAMPAAGTKNEFKMQLSSVDLMRSAVKEFNKIPELDFVVLTGDMTLNGEPWNVEMVKMVMDELKAPYYVVMGNHDLSMVPRPPKPGAPPSMGQYLGVTRSTIAWTFQGHGFNGSDLWWSLDPVPGLHIIGLDTNTPGIWGGSVPEKEVAWLDNDLYVNRDKLTIVFAHHNFTLWHKDEKESAKWKNYHWFHPDNAAEVRKVFEKYPQVSYVITGHRHIGVRYQELNDVGYFVIPAVCSYPMRYTVFTLTQDELSWDSKDIPISKKVWNEAKANLVGKDGEWWRCSDHKDDKKLLEFFEAKESMKGKVSVRTRP
ncbi:MAG: metallophosphoesterase [Desulfobacteraceae bacterium]|nr:metallophosphoesterase [Desulfobacteraceae bacterium]